MSSENLHNEKELLQRLAEGDESAFRQLFDAYYEPLLFFARGLLHEHALAEDSVMVAFTKFWELSSKFTEVAAVRAFLYTTVRHGCYRVYNQQQNMERHHTQAVQGAPENEELIESRMLMAEMVAYIRAEINKLNSRYRDVIYLLFVEECSVKETAERLNLTPENVRKRKERAIDMLRSRIISDRLANLSIFYLVIYTTLISGQ